MTDETQSTQDQTAEDEAPERLIDALSVDDQDFVETQLLQARAVVRLARGAGLNATTEDITEGLTVADDCLTRLVNRLLGRDEMIFAD